MAVEQAAKFAAIDLRHQLAPGSSTATMSATTRGPLSNVSTRSRAGQKLISHAARPKGAYRS